MQDLRKALVDLGDIRRQLAAGTMFRGFGPAVIATTGLLAFATAAAQALWFAQANQDPVLFVAAWVATAVICAVLIGVEMVARTRRHHQGLADEMLFNAVDHFLPIGVAGAAIAAVSLRFAPDTAWMLPGLWEILIALGLFAATRFLPRSVAVAAAWYFVAGVAVLIISSQSRELSPWAMGLPFGIGQILLAGILHTALGGDDDEAE